MSSVWHENGRSTPPIHQELRDAALGMLQARHAMRGTLPAELIHDVALEILLSLFIAHPQAVEIDSLLADATVPVGSARRWLALLGAERLVASADATAALSPYGVGQVSAMLAAVVQSQRVMLGWAHHLSRRHWPLRTMEGFMPEAIAVARPEDELLKEAAALLHKVLILLDAAGAAYAGIRVDHALALVEQQIRLSTN